MEKKNRNNLEQCSPTERLIYDAMQELSVLSSGFRFDDAEDDRVKDLAEICRRVELQMRIKANVN
jgi:hypothetical protein